MINHPLHTTAFLVKVNIIKEQKVQLGKCPICWEPFQDPHILPCQHIFCSHCLDVMSDPFPCPLCRHMSIREGRTPIGIILNQIIMETNYQCSHCCLEYPKDEIVAHVRHVAKNLFQEIKNEVDLSMIDDNSQLDEYVKFIVLKCLTQDYKEGSLLGAPFKIDKCWHKHILCTRSYRKMCRTFLGPDRFIDHDVKTANDSDLIPRIETSVQLCSLLFGKTNNMWHFNPEQEQKNKIQKIQSLYESCEQRHKEDGPVTIFIKWLNGNRNFLNVHLDTPIYCLYVRLSQKTNISICQMSFVCEGRLLSYDKTIDECEMSNESTMYCVNSMRGC